MSNTRHRSSWTLKILAMVALGAVSGPVAGQVPDPLVSGSAIVRLLDGVAIGDFITQFEADHAALNLGLAASDTIALAIILNVPHVCYHDFDSLDLRHAWRGESGTWATELVDAVGTTGHWCAIAGLT